MYKTKKKDQNNKFNSRNIDKCENEHLICSIVMTSTQRLPRTISEKINKDNKKQALFDVRKKISFLSTPNLKD